jgi:hypothetical protein
MHDAGVDRWCLEKARAMVHHEREGRQRVEGGALDGRLVAHGTVEPAAARVDEPDPPPVSLRVTGSMIEDAVHQRLLGIDHVVAPARADVDDRLDRIDVGEPGLGLAEITANHSAAGAPQAIP